MTEEERQFVNEAEAIAVGAEAVERTLTPRSPFDLGELLGPDVVGPLVGRVKVVGGEVEVLWGWSERSESSRR